MPIPADEKKRYSDFSAQLAREIGALSVPPDTYLWHYTTGACLIAILDSMSIFSTQVSCLNDTSELRYGSKLYREAIEASMPKFSTDSAASKLLVDALDYFKEDADFPFQASVPHFVASFSEERDDLSQWRAYGGGENGYAIGFKAQDLWGCKNALVARIIYDPGVQQAAARKAVEGMAGFFLEGLKKFAPADAGAFGEEFFEAWDPSITMVAPLIKDPGFSKERECRIVKGFELTDLENLKFLQKNSLMSRHLPLRPPQRTPTTPYRLAIGEVMVGPCRNPQISRTSVDTLLRQKGYPTGLVTISKIPFQVT